MRTGTCGRWIELRTHAGLDERAKPPDRDLVAVEPERADGRRIGHRCVHAITGDVVAAKEATAGNGHAVAAGQVALATRQRRERAARRCERGVELGVDRNGVAGHRITSGLRIEEDPTTACGREHGRCWYRSPPGRDHAAILRRTSRRTMSPWSRPCSALAARCN